MISAVMKRCPWVKENCKIYEDYHDQEWGVAVFDDKTLFEMLILEGAHAGLSWLTVLQKREGYRIAFDNFDLIKIAKYDDDKLAELMQNPAIVRNKLKIKSAKQNAIAFLEIQKEFGSFAKYLWAFIDFSQINHEFIAISQIPGKNDLSDKISKDLKKRGMNFVGSTIIYAYLQAIGVINDHVKSCPRHIECLTSKEKILERIK